MVSGIGPDSSPPGSDRGDASRLPGLMYSVRDGRLDFRGSREWMDADTEDLSQVVEQVRQELGDDEDDGYNERYGCDPMRPE